MRKTKRKRQVKNEQPYKVGKHFVKWLDSQIDVMYKHPNRYLTNRWDKIESEITLEAYNFIRSVVKS